MKRIVFAGLALAVLTGSASAHGKKEHGEKVTSVPANLDMFENEFGRTGRPEAVVRTIKVGMSDAFKYEPAIIHVKVGETIRFVVQNRGEMLHEMVVGRTEDIVKHAILMEKFPGMEHGEPYMAHADKGQTAEIIWAFSKPGTFEYGCLIPGHYDAGMKGVIYADGGGVITKGSVQWLHGSTGDNEKSDNRN